MLDCPVCAKPVDREGAPTTVYEGTTYYFRCPRCRERFTADPVAFCVGAPTLTTAAAASTRTSTDAPTRERVGAMSPAPITCCRVEYLIANPVRSAQAVRRELAARLASEPYRAGE